jgi:aminoglycoside 2'-N-acetyltransferase I
VVTVSAFATAEAPTGVLEAARALMDEAFAGDFDETDWDHALGGVHVVSIADGQVVAHGSVVPRTLWVGDRPTDTGYVEAVAVAPAHQRTGLGTAVMDRLGTVVRDRHEMGALGTGEFGFYERLGWERWAGETWVFEGELRRRSPDEDGYVMVLRHGTSAGFDLGRPIAWEARSGDDW